MKINSAWVKPPLSISGQDHLGTQAPSVAIYTGLLPGITNVTSRARYYSFYPWLIWCFQQRFPQRNGEEFQTTLRRAECLFALIGIRHSSLLGEAEDAHGGGMVGREVLQPAFQRLLQGGQLLLSSHARLDESDLKERYFKNPLGGLGQYYFGPLRDLGILGGETRTKELGYTPERGLPLAKAFSLVGLDKAFFDLLEVDEVTLADLDRLAALCPCGLHDNETERLALLGILVDPESLLGEESRPRRTTLTLLLDLVGRGTRVEDTSFDHEFRAAAYGGTLLDNGSWEVSDGIAPVLTSWCMYHRNELFSVAVEGLFWGALETAMSNGRAQFADTAELARFFLSSAVEIAVPAEILAESLAVAIQRVKSELTPISNWTEEEHEVQAAWRIFAAVRAKEPHEVARASLSILLTIAARDTGGDPYAGCGFDDNYFERYPINLRAFLRRMREDWAALTLKEVVIKLVSWAVDTHYRVALQKLAANVSRDTFRVRPTDNGLRVIAAPEPTFTAPRVQRAVGMLRDLGLLVNDENGNPMLTPAGQDVLGGLRD